MGYSKEFQEEFLEGLPEKIQSKTSTGIPCWILIIISWGILRGILIGILEEFSEVFPE